MSEQFNKFQLIVIKRISDHKEAEAKRLEAEREKIRAEEQAKAQANHIVEATKMVQTAQADHVADAGKTIQPAAIKESLTTAQTIKLGEICARLGFTVTADFMTHIGFPFVAHDKNAKLYRASDFPDICEAIAAHVLKAARRG